MRWLVLLLMLLICGTFVKSDNNYNPYLYDLTVPQFTPDGRLLQVEYANVASDHSTPIVAAVVSNNLAVLACCSRSRRDDASSKFAQQERLVVLPSSLVSCDNNDDCNTDGTSSSGIVVALSGVLADSLSLLQVVAEEAVNTNHRVYAGKKRLTALSVATCTANKCQRHAFGGGLRPVGATIFVTGSNSWVMNNNKLVVHKTDPSGAIQDIVVSGCTVLGGGTAGSLLQRRLQFEWANNQSGNGDDTARRRIGQLLNIMAKEHQQQENKGNDSSSSTGGLAFFEVVLISSTKGIFKLSQQQVQTLLQQIVD